ncbi:MAG TPA: outer membrane beta-barrel protein [Candidatus Solibacter sp.]|nr:outer membrane beta-barrel protein [Candidatus Solibacter sp.]
MSAKRFWIVVLLVTTIFAASALAQDERNEIGGVIGRTFISDQGIQNASYFDPIIHFGKGLSFEGEYARRFIVTPIYSVSAELPFVYNRDIDLNAGEYGHAVVPTDLQSYFVTPSARVNVFPTTAVSPWVSLGAGFGHFSESSTLVYGGTNPGKSKSDFALQAGLGLDVKVWKKLSMRGEVRDFWSGEPDLPLAQTGKSRMHNFFVGGGAFWRF